MSAEALGKAGFDWVLLDQQHGHFDDAAVRAITQGLVRVGLLKGRVPTLIKQEAYKKFYMHRTGHWLGLDVHDVGDYKIGEEWRVLEPGMALTIEPGIYFIPTLLAKLKAALDAFAKQFA